jgi:hypothetical protein
MTKSDPSPGESLEDIRKRYKRVIDRSLFTKGGIIRRLREVRRLDGLRLPHHRCNSYHEEDIILGPDPNTSAVFTSNNCVECEGEYRTQNILEETFEALLKGHSDPSSSLALNPGDLKEVQQPASPSTLAAFAFDGSGDDTQALLEETFEALLKGYSDTSSSSLALNNGDLKEVQQPASTLAARQTILMSGGGLGSQFSIPIPTPRRTKVHIVCVNCRKRKIKVGR